MLFRELRNAQGATLAKMGAKLGKGLAATARLMVGVPDYEAYVAHRRGERGKAAQFDLARVAREVGRDALEYAIRQESVAQQK